MADGPGKYDKECVHALVETEAAACVLIVIAGKDGSGFAVNSVSPEINQALPKLLREVADMIEGGN